MYRLAKVGSSGSNPLHMPFCDVHFVVFLSTAQGVPKTPFPIGDWLSERAVFITTFHTAVTSVGFDSRHWSCNLS